MANDCLTAIYYILAKTVTWLFNIDLFTGFSIGSILVCLSIISITLGTFLKLGGAMRAVASSNAAKGNAKIKAGISKRVGH